MIDFRDSYKPGEARTIDKMPRTRKKSLYLSILAPAGLQCLAAVLACSAAGWCWLLSCFISDLGCFGISKYGY